MQAELILIGGEIVNVNTIARVLWKDNALWINTASGFVKLRGDEANRVWQMLESRITFDGRTGRVQPRTS